MVQTLESTRVSHSGPANRICPNVYDRIRACHCRLCVLFCPDTVITIDSRSPNPAGKHNWPYLIPHPEHETERSENLRGHLFDAECGQLFGLVDEDFDLPCEVPHLPIAARPLCSAKEPTWQN
jgi:hypothetical protein